ncbi:MAG TPA: DUF3943 domain-containing protein [Gemmatimonadaceae bacterium]|nr:DUF3943 domain-containing protein [Gemmatimonadaceae bacterium]
MKQSAAGDDNVARFCLSPLPLAVSALAALAALLPLLLAAPLRAQAPRPAGIVRADHHTRTSALVLAGTSVASFGVLWVLPEEMSKWPKEDRQMNHFLDAYRSPPVWDRDPFFWNYIAHPVIGQYTYLMERNYGESRLRSFLFSTAASVAWEYGVEAAIEHPSAQDLLTTSPVGSLLGEASYVATRRMARDGFNRWEKAAMLLVNPVYVVQSRGMRRPMLRMAPR